MNNNENNILIVVPSLERGGGAERVAAMVGSGLSNHANQVYYFTFHDYDPKYEFTGKYFTLNEKIRGNVFTKALGQIKRAQKINNYCNQHDIDTVISFMTGANFACCLSRIIFQNKSRIICSVRNNPIRNNNWLHKILIRKLYPFADMIVAISNGVEELLRSKFPISDVTTIYNPIERDLAIERSEDNIAKKYERLFKETFTFINIASLTKQKGHSHLIRSFSELVQENKNVNLVILGKGKLRNKIENLIQECNLKNRIHLLGNQENVFKFLRVADQFVLSSLWEGLGNVILESMAVGTPVTSTDCLAGPREIIAQDIPVRKMIDYPYKSNCGTLTQPFSTDHIFKTPQEKTLTEEELMLARQMKESLSRADSDVERSCVKKFEKENVINSWSDLISCKGR